MKYSNSLSKLTFEPYDVLPFPNKPHRPPSELRGFGCRKPEKRSYVKFFPKQIPKDPYMFHKRMYEHAVSEKELPIFMLTRKKENRKNFTLNPTQSESNLPTL